MNNTKLLPRLLKDGTFLNVSLATVIGLSLRLNPEIWVHDYPPDIKERFGPKSEKAKRQTWLAAIPFFFLLIGVVVRSNLALKRDNGGHLPLKMAFLNSYGLFAYFWLFDLVILDWLLFVTLKPSFVVLPGTEGMAGYDDYGFHLKAALPALPAMALPALIIALFTSSRKPS
jgi:hypothetical protein